MRGVKAHLYRNQNLEKMKNSKKIILASLLLVGIVGEISAQRKSKKKEEGEMKVVVVNTENGEVTKTENTYSLEDMEKVKQMLKEKGIELDMDKNMGVKVKVDGEGDMDKKIVVTKVGDDGQVITTEEHVKVITLEGEGSHQVEDIQVDVEDVAGKVKVIRINSDQDASLNREIIIETLSDGIDEGKTMVFVRKNTSTSTNNLPQSISEVFEGENSLKDLALFPNPTNGTFTMQFHSNRSDDFTLSITDMKGAKVYEKTLRKFKGEFKEEFDLSAYDAGVYLFNLTSKEQSLTKRIVVE